VIKPILFLLGLGVYAPSFALHTQAVQDNVRVILPLSRTEITRITVEKDRIQQVIGPKSSYQLQVGESQGDIYLQPQVAYPFSIFIETERGHYLALLLQPTARPAESIALIPQELPHAR
jgi:hypothetical protein